MTKCLRLIKLLMLLIVFCLILFYTTYWEPYCFIKRSLNTNNISNYFKSDIITYRLNESSSNSKNVISMLISKFSVNLVERLKLLDSNFNDNYVTGVVLMHTNNVNLKEKIYLTNIMKRRISFLDVSDAFHLFPMGFDPCRRKTSYRVRGKWNYLLMIRFWSKLLFELPQFDKYEYIMRLDDDSKLTGKWFNVFDKMIEEKSVYFANNIDLDLEDQLPGTMKIKDFTYNYIKENNIKPKQIEMLNRAFTNKTVLNFYNNFEVTKLAFFRDKQVRHWIDSIDKSNGIFDYRWGDAILRYLTLALFSHEYQILHRSKFDLPYCHKCL